MKFLAGKLYIGYSGKLHGRKCSGYHYRCAGQFSFYKGGIIAYANAVKENLLHVKSETLEAHGAVSEETVTEMVHGAMKTLEADYAVATSGVAGPSGGTADKPVGTIWIAAGNAQKVLTAKLTEDEGREKNIQAATKKHCNYCLN